MNKLFRCFCVALSLGGLSAVALAERTSTQANSSLPASQELVSSAATPSGALNSSDKLVPSGGKKPAPAIPRETLFWLYGLLFLGVGFFAYKFWKRGALVRSNSKQSKLNVLEMRMLGNKQFLLVVEYDGQRMLLGVSPGIIQHICILGEGGVLLLPYLL